MTASVDQMTDDQLAAYAEAQRVIEQVREMGADRLSLWGAKDSALEHLSHLPPDIATLPKVTSIDLDDTQVSDITSLRDLTGVQSLTLDNTRVSDITPLRDLTGLQILTLYNTQVSDIPPLRGLTGLQRLDLNNTRVSDITPLRDLTGLQRLELRNTQVSDITPLRDLTGLQRLELDNTRVSDITPLRDLTALLSLTLRNTKVSNITPLRGLTGVQHLNLRNTQVSDITPLRDLTGLQSLILGNTQVSDITPLRGLTGLQNLTLNNTQISDLRPLLDLDQLWDKAGQKLPEPLYHITGGIWFRGIPMTQADDRLAEISVIQDNKPRADALRRYLQALPKWPDPLPWDVPSTPPAGEVTEVEQDPALPIIWTDAGLDFAANETQPDPVTEASLEELRALIDLLSRKANMHDDLRGLTDRMKLVLEGCPQPDATRLHLIYQGLRRLYEGRDTRPEPFDVETISALDRLQDCVPGITLGNPHVQDLLARQRLDQDTPSPAIDQAREDAMLTAMVQDDAPVSPDLRAVAQDVLAADPTEPLGAMRRLLSRNTMIRALTVAAAGGLGIGTWILTQSPEIQSLAASMGDDAYWWATRIIDKVKAAFEARTFGP